MIYTLTLNPAIDKQLTVVNIARNSVLRATDSRSDIGGKGFNISRMLRSLGASSIAIAFAGGHTGQQLESGLNELGIKTSFVRVPGETRTNISIVNASYDDYIKVNEAGPTIPESAQANLLELITDLATANSWWTLSGSLPPGVPTDFYTTLIHTLHEQGARTVLDVSGAALGPALAAAPFLAKPNEIELAEFSGGGVDTVEEIVAAARRILTAGPENIVISLGKKGALFVNQNEAIQFSPPVIKEMNPIGAGDSMVAGIVYQLSQGKTLEEAISWGIACGSATAAQPGTIVGTAEQVQRLHHLVQVQRVKGI